MSIIFYFVATTPKPEETDGAAKLGRPRPVKVALSDQENKKKRMKNLSKLRNVPTDSVYHKVSVSHDMTRLERQANTEQLDQARALNENDSSKNYRYIDRSPPWVRRIIKKDMAKE
jgi:hypothetical protein